MTQTFAEEAGIELVDAPTPLFQLLTLCMLQAKPIKAPVAVAAARGLFNAGLTGPQAVAHAPRSTLIRVFGRTGYARYDESTATRLKAMSAKLLRDFGGDVSTLRDGAPASLEVFDGVGPACAAMFAREAQGVWPELAPVFDKKALEGARLLGLSADPDKLATMSDDLPRFAARLVRAALKG
ncbi:endonuclease [Corynebacterium qintianiae]|uniref:Endonuclease n=1 Tax=Corynebacterium qintianiae TaxID=2709392 RepID=A0A7T0KMG3_9CORY|nr:endonuclease [Corynebacterium qintianiae]QPK83081.1 endonuclease [Corynebacterium qintianiae]